MSHRIQTTHPTNFKLTALVAGSVMLVGCATPLTREERIGQDDGSDPCRRYVVALDSTGNFFAEDMIKGAVEGAVAGAIAGGLIGLLSGGSGGDIAKGAAIGAAVGGVAGAVGGYYNAQMKQGRDQAILAINEDLTREASELEKADTAVDALISCRISQRDQIRSDYARRRISRDEAKRNWAILQEQVNRDNELMQMVATNIGKRQEEYLYASEQVAGEFDMSRLPPAEQQIAKRRMQENEQRIEQNYRREVAQINRESAKGRKKGANQRATTQSGEDKKNRLAAAERARNKQQEINRKTGGDPKAMKVATNFSSTQNKAERVKDNAKNFTSKVAVSDGGFENSESRFWHEFPAYVYAIDPQGMTVNDRISRNPWLAFSQNSNLICS